eukprot:scaffold99278_cov19-Tisochrysis_lutea.AAC.1
MLLKRQYIMHAPDTTFISCRTHADMYAHAHVLMYRSPAFTLQTYTMGTAIENMGPDVNKAMGKADGIIPRLIVSLFGYTAAASEIYDIELK